MLASFLQSSFNLFIKTVFLEKLTNIRVHFENRRYCLQAAVILQQANGPATQSNG